MSKIKNKINVRLVLALVLSLLFIVGFSQQVAANTKTGSSSSSLNQAVTQSYNADTNVDLGMIVEQKPNSTNTVQALTQLNSKNMLGVVVDPNQSTIALTPQNVSHQQIYVATTGRYEVLVSNQDGTINDGDPISISSLAGIGMKADQNEAEIVGKAAGTFDGSAGVIGTQSITNSLGKSIPISIGSVAVNLGITHNPLQTSPDNYVPSYLARAASSVASKQVSTGRVYLCMAILIIAAFLTGIIVYTGIRGSMIAIGRNPLSKKSIMRGLIQTVISGLIVFIVGIFGVYLLLKL
jgi:hypothetical protein